MDKYVELFIQGVVLAALFIGVPKLWKLGKQKKEESILAGKVYYGLIYCRILLFYALGVICGEMILMVIFGDSIQGAIALLLTLISGIPFAILFTHLYKKSFIKKYLS